MDVGSREVLGSGKVGHVLEKGLFVFLSVLVGSFVFFAGLFIP